MSGILLILPRGRRAPTRGVLPHRLDDVLHVCMCGCCACVQLILKSKCVCAVVVQWLVARGPWGEARLAPRLAAHSFRDDDTDAPPQPLPLADAADANRLLSNKAIHFRYTLHYTTLHNTHHVTQLMLLAPSILRAVPLLTL